MKIIGYIKSKARSWNWIYKPLSDFYQTLIRPIFNGYFIYMIKYYFLIRNNEVSKLKEYGFSNIATFKSKSWRRGTGQDHAHRRYYTANRSGIKCFIKVAENDKTIANEIVVSERLKGHNFSFTPKWVCSEDKFLGNLKMLAIEYQEGLHPIAKEDNLGRTADIPEATLLQFCNEFLSICKQLDAVGLVHADIHKGNMMVDKDGHLCLLDFGISKFVDTCNDNDYKARPGTFYQVEGKIRIYDDVYSFLKMLERYPSSSKIKNSSVYKEVESRLGALKFKVEIV